MQFHEPSSDSRDISQPVRQSAFAIRKLYSNPNSSLACVQYGYASKQEFSISVKGHLSMHV